MARKGGNPDLKGNKNSGRKGFTEEWSKIQAIKKAWDKVNDELEDKDVEKVALPLVLKDMVAKVGNPDGSNIVIPIYGGISKHEGNGEDIQTEKKD